MQVCSVELAEGDTIVMGSDGLFDNVFDQEIISTIYKFEDVTSAGRFPQSCLLLIKIFELCQLNSAVSSGLNFPLQPRH